MGLKQKRRVRKRGPSALENLRSVLGNIVLTLYSSVSSSLIGKNDSELNLKCKIYMFDFDVLDFFDILDILMHW